MIKEHMSACKDDTALSTVARICEKVRDIVNRKDAEYYGSFNAYVKVLAK